MPVDRDTFERGEKRHSIENDIIRFLHDNSDKAYNVHELTLEVMEAGWSEANVDSEAFEEQIGCFLDLATVNTIVDQLVDDGRLNRRILETDQGSRSYYRAP